MIRIKADEFKTVPWKNGKGITQHIISSTDSDDYDWRFSRADVSVDGPFSIFNGKSRILTVIEGNGLTLISDRSTIEAKPFEPVSFSGDIEIMGKLNDGPIKDLNLIYSSKRIEAEVRLIQEKQSLHLKPDHLALFAVYCLSGVINDKSDSELRSGDFGLIKNIPCSLTVNDNSRLLLYSLKHLSG